jgi:predicted ATPase
MKLKRLTFERFCSFDDYDIVFPQEDEACTLITGKNNAGKSTILLALKLVNSAMSHGKGSKKTVHSTLTKKDVLDFNINRLIHNFELNDATITALFDEDREVKVIINSEEGCVDYILPPHYERTMQNVFGFIPPLGQIAQIEERLNKEYVSRCIDTHLSPSHLRNQIFHLLNKEEFNQVSELIKQSWEGIDILYPEYDFPTNTISCIYRQDNSYREIAMAGQGFQIWLQIIFHTIRLLDKSVLILDEPEIFLHPEKQHKLIEILNDLFPGSLIIATHSSELMNNVDISHIIPINRDTNQARPLQAKNKAQIDKIRINIGSSFNLIASQYEDVQLMLVTEQKSDYDVIHQIASSLKKTVKMQNVITEGFSNYKKAIYYKKSYREFYGKDVKCVLLLDRDYFPDGYLEEIRQELTRERIKLIYTPGKEIENLFLNDKFLLSLIPKESQRLFSTFMNDYYTNQYNTCLDRYLGIYHDYQKNLDFTTILRLYRPHFDQEWNNAETRYKLAPGKQTLSLIRKYFKDTFNKSLTTNTLISELIKSNKEEATQLINSIYD